MAVEKLVGKTKFVATKVLGSPQGTPPFYRIAEIHFPSMQALEACANSEGAKETLAHAASIVCLVKVIPARDKQALAGYSGCLTVFC
jgi:hypothetical protein